MNLTGIIAISGKPGLYALKVQTRTGFVAESLIDGKKITALILMYLPTSYPNLNIKYF